MVYVFPFIYDQSIIEEKESLVLLLAIVLFPLVAIPIGFFCWLFVSLYGVIFHFFFSAVLEKEWTGIIVLGLFYILPIVMSIIAVIVFIRNYSLLE